MYLITKDVKSLIGKNYNFRGRIAPEQAVEQNDIFFTR